MYHAIRLFVHVITNGSAETQSWEVSHFETFYWWREIGGFMKLLRRHFDFACSFMFSRTVSWTSNKVAQVLS